uniref:Uncharacterized protein n=1 Tax=Guillardia theta TaxID=55529 RepID=A0A7S4LZD5_GUITH|mmetsp:Transcript_108/g.236  ORF Transcript_108/g.236 Transcript_108/m.236 type:complete len:634 (+) Transcript_108:163-2064(+)
MDSGGGTFEWRSNDALPRSSRCQHDMSLGQSGTQSLYECPKFVPFQLLAQVQQLLLDNVDGRRGFQHEAFKLCLRRSELMSVLKDMRREGSRSRQDRDSRDLANSWPNVVDVKHVFAAALPFLESDVVMARLNITSSKESLEERALICLQTRVKALFLLHCVFYSQTAVKKEPILLTPASWRHVLDLCQLAHQLQERRSAALQVKSCHTGDWSSVILRGEDADMSDFCSAFRMLYMAGAMRFAAVPAAMNASNYRRWVNQEAEQDQVPEREQNNAETISKGFKMAEQVLEDLHAGRDLETSRLEEAVNKYCEAKNQLKEEGELVPFYLESKIADYLQDTLKRSEVEAPRRKGTKRKEAEEPEERNLDLLDLSLPDQQDSSRWEELLRTVKQRMEAYREEENQGGGISSAPAPPLAPPPPPPPASDLSLPTFSHQDQQAHLPLPVPLEAVNLPEEERMSRELEAELEEALAEEEAEEEGSRRRREEANKRRVHASTHQGAGSRRRRQEEAVEVARTKKVESRRKGGEETRKAEAGKRKRPEQEAKGRKKPQRIASSRGTRTRRRRGDEWEEERLSEEEQEKEQASQSERFRTGETVWTEEAVKSFLELTRRMDLTRKCFLAALPTPAALLREDG